MNEELKSKKKRLQLAFALALLVLITIFFSNSKSELLENDTSVKTNSELTYYLNVSYDGVDRNGIQSSDTKISKINSGTIFVEDKLPEGLEFIGFVTTDNGTIGAVKRDDETVCAGKVVDDTNEETNEGKWNEANTEFTYHGLHYSKDTNTVSFKVKYLQAGCKLSVGIITKTPSLDDPTTEEIETRRDFYNFATARERTLNARSNTVHVFMGKENSVQREVIYLYDGTPPENAPSLPEVTNYAVGAKVGVAANPKMEGYTFSGWTSENVEVANNSFTMPNDAVLFKGSFTRDNDYKITYEIEGDTPEQYVLPSDSKYYPGTVVELDTLKAGDIINGYRFKGWTSTDVEITDDKDFTMPTSDVTIKGSFEEEKYKVTYKFGNGIKPPNANSLLPPEQEYRPGEEVTLEEIASPSGYEFLGWYENNQFEMPQENVVILGEWKAKSGEFQPETSLSIRNEKEYYQADEFITYDYTITNTAGYPIKDVLIQTTLDGTYQAASPHSSTYVAPHIVKIDEIQSGDTVTLSMIYQVSLEDKNSVTNTTEIISASADNGFELAEGDYSVTKTSKIKSKLKVCMNVRGAAPEAIFQLDLVQLNYSTTLYPCDDCFETWVSLHQDECKTLFVNPGYYKIKETMLQEFERYSYQISNNSFDEYNIFRINENEEVTATITNQFRRKGFMHSFDSIENKIFYGGIG